MKTEEIRGYNTPGVYKKEGEMMENKEKGIVVPRIAFISPRDTRALRYN